MASSTHTVHVPCLTHTQREDKTRHGNGDTHMGMDDMTHTQGGKGREKTRGGTREDTQALLFSKMKKRRKDNEEWLKTMKAYGQSAFPSTNHWDLQPLI